MSSICGIIDRNKRTTDFSVLHEMGRATVLRGGDQSGAYVNGNVGIYCNRRIGEEDEEMRQPYTVTVNGKNYTAVVDGEINGAPRSSAETAIEYYLSFGKDCFSKFDGDFALAICDEYRGETLLARSMGSSRPLYCSYNKGRLVFSSEIKGMLRASSGAVRLDGKKIRDHLFAPAGIYGAGDIYMDIDELPSGQCVIFSPLGIQFMPCASACVKNECREDIIIPDEPDISDMRLYLAEALVAFDYPQFDMFMPSVMDVLRNAKTKQKRTVLVVDGTLGYSEKYVKERTDRLGGFFGVSLVCASSDPEHIKDKSYKKIDKALETVLNTCDIKILEGIYGEGTIERVRSERSIEARIRMTGMLCQTSFLAKTQPILICTDGITRDVYASRLSTI